MDFKRRFFMLILYKNTKLFVRLFSYISRSKKDDVYQTKPPKFGVIGLILSDLYTS
jgi:hypothetical protein